MNNMNFLNYMNFMNNINNWNDMNMNNINQTNTKYFFIRFISLTGFRILIKTSSEERVSDLIKKFKNKVSIGGEKFIFQGKKISYNSELTLSQAGIEKNEYPPIILVVDRNNIIGAGLPNYNKEINIKFLKLPSSVIYKNNNKDIKGILKLCLLKEVYKSLQMIN